MIEERNKRIIKYLLDNNLNLEKASDEFNLSIRMIYLIIKNHGIDINKLKNSEIYFKQRFYKNVETNEFGCYLWTKGNYASGYGQVWFNGKHQQAHRISYYLTNGKYPNPICMHLCEGFYSPTDNTYKRCINPDHLIKSTYLENNLDALKNKRRVPPPPVKKLNKEQVLEIRDLYNGGNYIQKELAEKFNISIGHVSRIVNREFWKNI